MSYSLFDIAGPVMVGPSSSHTAGACKIGQMARAIFDTTPEKIIFNLHGSFGQVYKGHATDRALLAGAMKYRTSDTEIKKAFEIAKRKKIKYEFHVKDLNNGYHPNTVEIIMYKTGRKPMSVIGSSIGGGVIEIIKINDFAVSLREVAGKYKSLIVAHTKQNALKNVLKEIEKKNIRIFDTRSTKYKNKILTIVDTEGRRLTVKEVLEFEKIKNVEFVRALSKLPN